MNNTNNASRIISLINNVYSQSVFFIFKQQNNSDNINSNTGQTHDNNDNSTSLSRSRLQMVWDRLQTLSVRQRNSILNAITNSSQVNNESYIFRRAVRRRSETDIQSQSNVNHKREEVISKINKVEYIDYRSYPLIIDWKEVSYKGSACNISKNYGLFGVSLYSTLTNTFNLKLTTNNLLPTVINYFIKSQEKVNNKMKKGNENYNNNEIFINSLPDLDSIYIILNKYLFSDIELVPIKTILDIYESHYKKIDFPMFENYKKVLNISFTFYYTLDEEQFKYLYENLYSNKELFELLSNKLGSMITKNKAKVLKRIKNLEFDTNRLTEGTKLSMFTN